MRCRIDKNVEKYLMCSPPDMIDDVIHKASFHCDPPEKVIRGINVIEVTSPKGKIKKELKENDEDILNIEIKN